jgi:hypothetical protein
MLHDFFQKDKRGMAMKVNISKKMVALVFAGVGFGFTHTSASALTLEAAWVQGTAAAIEAPTNVTMNKFGWGAVFDVPKGNGAWVHLALPTPVIAHGVRTKLQKILVQYTGTAKIDQVDVWDGSTKIATQVVNWTGNHTAYGNWGTVTIPNFPLVFYGVSVSLHIKNPCLLLICANRSMNLVSTGGDFYN